VKIDPAGIMTVLGPNSHRQVVDRRRRNGIATLCFSKAAALRQPVA
jgi:hypothetical protein